mmetsp:Transcript_7576/g.8805  ORF Transcript_7576/g.8805 Transcript_7576/m.8805 type:complete len:174 (+) Transcript_7576:110-631(+)
MADDDESIDVDDIEEEEEVEEEEVTDLSNSDVCTKYQEASKIVNLALTGLVSQCIPGAKIIDLCNFGTTVIDASAAKLYTKKVNGKEAIEKGVAFPVCISVNEIVCNHSPLVSEELVSFFSFSRISFKKIIALRMTTNQEECKLDRSLPSVPGPCATYSHTCEPSCSFENGSQ